MRDTDFIDEVKPAIFSNVEFYLKKRIEDGKLPADFNYKIVIENLHRAVDDWNECVRLRGLKYCRYIGSNQKGQIMMGRTTEGSNAIRREDEQLYRFIVEKNLYEMSVIPFDEGPSQLLFTNFQHNYYDTIAHICDPGCSCNPRYGKK